MTVIHDRMQRATDRTAEGLSADRAQTGLSSKGFVEQLDGDSVVSLQQSLLLGMLGLLWIPLLPSEVVLTSLVSVDGEAFSATPTVIGSAEVISRHEVASAAETVGCVSSGCHDDRGSYHG
jgi:hypothetical protein